MIIFVINHLISNAREIIVKYVRGHLSSVFLSAAIQTLYRNCWLGTKFIRRSKLRSCIVSAQTKMDMYIVNLGYVLQGPVVQSRIKPTQS